jgi:hypothetical protein
VGSCIVAIGRKRNLDAVRRPSRLDAAERIIRQRDDIRSIRIHHIDFLAAKLVRVAGKRDFCPVR